MLKNYPPDGTDIRIMKDGRSAKLIRPLLKREGLDLPGDEFTIKLPDGTIATVRRDEIEEKAGGVGTAN